MKITFTLILFFLSFQIIAQDLNSAIQIGSIGNDEAYHIEVDSENNFFLSGNFMETVDFDTGSGTTELTSSQLDIFVAKYSNSGDLIWVFNIPSTKGVEHFTIDEMDNIYITGHFSPNADFDPGTDVFYLPHDIGDKFLAKYDKDGNLLWVVELGKKDDLNHIGGIAIDLNGDVIFGGSFENKFYFLDADGTYQWYNSTTNSNIFMAKINGTSGLFKWAVQIGTPSEERLFDLTVDAENNIYFTGQIFGITDFDLGPFTNNLEPVGGSGDAYVVKWDNDANFIWGGVIGGDAVSSGNSITVDHNNDILLTGGYGGSMDFDMGPGVEIRGSSGPLGNSYINKFDSDGNFIWVNTYGTNISPGNLGHSGKPRVDANNNIYQAGSFTDDLFMPTSIGNITLTPTGTSDILVAKIHSSGDFIWGKQMSGTAFNHAWDLALNQDDKILVTGYFKDTVDFDPGSGIFNLNTDGDKDIFITNLNQNCPDFTVAISNVNNVLCTTNGSATVAAIGGTSPYAYEWNTNPISTNSSATIETAGNYTVTVSDDNGCEHILGTSINGPGNDAFNQFDLSGYLIAHDFRTGFNANVWLNVFNKNCLATDGQVKLVSSSSLEFLSANVTPNVISGDTLIWNFPSIAFDDPSFKTHLVFEVSPLAAIGDTVSLELIVAPLTDDANPSNNIKTYYYPIINSYDPNDKNVYPARCEANFISNEENLTYTVRFQNTGNAEAININILDTLDSNLDIQTLRVVANSHPLITEIQEGNILNFKFSNILLPDSTSNEAESHGYVIFEINPKPNLPLGTTIKNTANIYFDFNEAIVTNTIVNTISDDIPDCTPFVSVGIEKTALEKLDFQVSPNPTFGNIQLFFNNNINAIEINIVDMRGKNIYTFSKKNINNPIELDLSNIPNGIYFIHLQNEKYNGIRRFVKMKN